MRIIIHTHVIFYTHLPMNFLFRLNRGCRICTFSGTTACIFYIDDKNHTPRYMLLLSNFEEETKLCVVGGWHDKK